MWDPIHADRSPWAASEHVGRLLKDGVPRLLWQELTGPSGHKLSLLEAGGGIHSDRSLGHLRTCSDASEDVGPRPHSWTLMSSACGCLVFPTPFFLILGSGLGFVEETVFVPLDIPSCLVSINAS